MRPAYRAAITAGSIVAVAVIALTFRSLTAFGVFTDVVPGFSGVCAPIRTANGPEDIAIDEASGLVFVSALDRRAKARTGKPSAADGLYVFSLSDKSVHPRKLAGAPSDFHPHGISLYRAPNGVLTLMAINHRSDGTHSVDIFTVTGQGAAVALAETGSIQGGQLVSPNAIAAVDAARFYVTNDHGSVTQLGRTLDDDLVLPRANTLYFDGNVFRIAVQRQAFPSGAAVSADGRFLFIGESYNRRVTAFARNPYSGELSEIGDIALPANVDNLRLDSKGNLWAGSHPKAFAMAAWRADPSKPAPSEIFKITVVNGVPKEATAVYANLGSEIGGSSVGAVSGHRLLIGSPFDNHILDCTMDH